MQCQNRQVKGMYLTALSCCTPAFRNIAIQITLTLFTTLLEIPNTTGHYCTIQFHYSIWFPTIFAAQLYFEVNFFIVKFNFFFFTFKHNLQAGNNQNSVHTVYNCSLSKHSTRKRIKKYFINFCHCSRK